MSLVNILFTTIVTVWAAIGTILIKNGNFAGGLFFYSTTTFFWYKILRDSRMIAVGTVYGIVSVIVDVLTGVLLYKEVPTVKEIFGCILGIVAIILTTV